MTRSGVSTLNNHSRVISQNAKLFNVIWHIVSDVLICSFCVFTFIASFAAALVQRLHFHIHRILCMASSHHERFHCEAGQEVADQNALEIQATDGQISDLEKAIANAGVNTKSEFCCTFVFCKL